MNIRCKEDIRFPFMCAGIIFEADIVFILLDCITNLSSPIAPSVRGAGRSPIVVVSGGRNLSGVDNVALPIPNGVDEGGGGLGTAYSTTLSNPSEANFKSAIVFHRQTSFVIQRLVQFQDYYIEVSG